MSAFWFFFLAGFFIPLILAIVLMRKGRRKSGVPTPASPPPEVAIVAPPLAPLPETSVPPRPTVVIEEPGYWQRRRERIWAIPRPRVSGTVLAVAAVVLLAFLAWQFPPERYSASERVATPEPKVVVREVFVRPTSRVCPEKLSSIEELQEGEEYFFNPKGCYYYLTTFSGKIRLWGPEGHRMVRPGKSPFDARRMFYAKAEGGPAQWQYILCERPKQNNDSLDCA